MMTSMVTDAYMHHSASMSLSTVRLAGGETLKENDNHRDCVQGRL